MKKDYDIALLHTPDGVRDYYNGELKLRKNIEKGISSIAESFGYDELRTPTFEFFDVFAKEIGTTPSKDLFKFFDKDNNTLVLRPDFTPSVARCAAKYFIPGDKCESPVRLYYKGSVYSHTHALMGGLEESGEIGAELIGCPDAYADGEVLALLIESLKASGLDDFRISIGHIDYFRGLCEDAGLGDTDEEHLRELISGKNTVAAGSFLSELGISEEAKEKLLRIADSFEDHGSLDKLTEKVSSEKAKAAVSGLQEVYEVLTAYGYEKYISFDLGLLSKFNYYTGIIFRAYTYGVGSPVAKGGRYDKLLGYFGKEAPAIGFAISEDTLTEALSRLSDKKEKLSEEKTVIEFDKNEKSAFADALKKAQELRGKGKKVILSEVKK